jgi:hypothetical protein
MVSEGEEPLETSRRRYDYNIKVIDLTHLALNRDKSKGVVNMVMNRRVP